VTRPLHRVELVCKDAIYKNTNNDKRRDLYQRKKRGHGKSKLSLVSIRSDNMQLFEFIRHRLKFNENSSAIKFLDAAYIDEDGSSTSQLRCFIERDMILSISFDFIQDCTCMLCILSAKVSHR